MEFSILGTAIACILVAMTLILIPMAPGGLIDTRDFAELPRWQFTLFNAFLTSLGIASVVTAGFALSGAPWASASALVLGLLYAAVFALDLGKIFPVVADQPPVQLLLLEVLDLALAGVLVVLAVQALLT